MTKITAWWTVWFIMGVRISGYYYMRGRPRRPTCTSWLSQVRKHSRPSTAHTQYTCISCCHLSNVMSFFIMCSKQVIGPTIRSKDLIHVLRMRNGVLNDNFAHVLRSISEDFCYVSCSYIY